MFRHLLLAVPIVLTPLAASAPAPASAAAAAASQSRTGEDCQRRSQGRRRGLGAAGAIGGALLGGFGGRAASIVVPMGSVLGGELMNLLDCREQEKAAQATEQVTEQATVQAERGGNAVGTTATWESETRPGVTGRSTVTAVNRTGGDDCMTVTDVVIIDGQETTAPKTMCRRPPTNRYVRV
jgi:surface antigen